MVAEVVVWIVLGAVIGATARLALRNGRGGILVTVLAAVAGALVGGFAGDALLGDGATIRMMIVSGSSFAAVRFGLVPAVFALVGAMLAIGLTAARPSGTGSGYRLRSSDQ